MKENIVLIGMPGAGKSTIGVLLAKALNMSFLDTDLLIQKKENKLLQEIIEEKGISEFLDIEKNVILEVKVSNTVIATGGSVILRDEAMKHLKKTGFVFYLNLPYKVIQRRLYNIKTRGIAMDKNKGLLDVYKERVPLYEKYADKIIQCAGRNVEDIVTEMTALWKSVQ
ncbi:MAG: shikimate kinase [Epulopiscium sp.]|jgi:shikimate kinase|nr:shikimate kinase [Candidatus Epulonipiscium sp.]HOQ16677.1 shikimate kinase [Defluviitaleaceae bacterium]HPT76179.1 shikimate kinase [Defluviitaleaceae bacterium]